MTACVVYRARLPSHKNDVRARVCRHECVYAFVCTCAYVCGLASVKTVGSVASSPSVGQNPLINLTAQKQ
eukprot:1454804-Pyramimonas_sp.AAC.1